MDINSIVELKANPDVPEINPGDSVKVSAKVVEGDKERIQVFQGVVIRVRRAEAGPTITVRRVAYGVGVERTFPLNSPRVEKVEVLRHGKVRRARLFYLRGLSVKQSRIKERRVEKELGITAEAEQAPVEVPPTEAAPVAEVTQKPPAEEKK
jgi:large subunit ribosomal protein L19